MDEPGSGDVAAMLNREGVNYATLPRVPNDGDPQTSTARQISPLPSRPKFVVDYTAAAKAA